MGNEGRTEAWAGGTAGSADGYGYRLAGGKGELERPGKDNLVLLLSADSGGREMDGLALYQQRG